MESLYTYALVSTIYDEKGDYIDCFLPFVLSVIDSKVSNTLGELKGRTTEKYSLEIPTHSLKTILTRCKRKGYLTLENRQYILNEKGEKFNEEIEQKQTRREIAGFLNKLEEYVEQKGLDAKEIENAFQQYIIANLKSLFYFIDAEAYQLDKNIRVRNEAFSCITEFIIKVENTSPELFKVFQNIVFGKIIALSIQGVKDISEMQQNFSKTTLFLDTNVVFDILGLQGIEAQKVTDEFVKLTQKSKKFTFRVFDFTVDEIIRVISSYLSQSNKYLSGVRVDSIYYYLKAKGWKRSEVSHFIQNIDHILLEKGIHISQTEKFIPIEGFDDKINKLAEYKPEGLSISYKHDLRAIIEVGKLRSNRVSKFEKAEFFFLSQDAKLGRFNFFEFEHKQYQSVPEVVLERALTNLLWLKEPKDIPLNALISFHKKYAVVDQGVWKIFYNKILSAKEDDQDFYNDTTTLLCHNQLQSTLSDLDEEATEEDIEIFVKKGAKLVRQHEEKERSELLLKQREEIEQNFDSQIEQVKVEHNQQLNEIRNNNIEALIKHRDKAVKKGIRISNIVWNIFRAIASLLLIFLGVIFLPKICENWQYIEPIAWLISIVIGSLFGIYGFNWIKLKPKLDEYYKQKKLKEIHLEELMKSLYVNESELEK